MICEKATRAHPDGRTGTAAGRWAHVRIGETPCEPCRGAYSSYTNADRKPETPESRRSRKLKFNYAMTIEGYDSILDSQDGGCAICGTDTPGGVGRFHVDHDHSCCPGKQSCGQCVRGLLCANCNRAIGLLNDNVERMRLAIRYLEGGQK